MRGAITCDYNLQAGTLTVTVHEATGHNRTFERLSRTFVLNTINPYSCPAFRRYMIRLFRLGLGEACTYRDQHWVPKELREVGMEKCGWVV